MPRVEILKPAVGNKPPESVSIDICNCCFHDAGLRAVIEGYEVPDDIVKIDPKEIPPKSVITSTDAEHPPYEAEETPCYMCDDPLMEEDNLLCDPHNEVDFEDEDEDEDDDDDWDEDDEEDDDDDYEDGE